MLWGALGPHTAPNDLTIQGRKFSGNAQYRLGGCIVHHGSLLFDTDLQQMEAATTVDRYKIVSKGIQSVRDRVTNIAEHLPAPMDPETFKKCIVEHILGDGAVYTVTEEDDARIREIAAERFASWESVYGADPAFNIQRTGRFAGGKMDFRLEVRKGLICHAAVFGDFFSSLDAETICGAAGPRYRWGDLSDICKGDGGGYRGLMCPAESWPGRRDRSA